MTEITGNLWDYRMAGTVVITTNGTIKKDGSAVMGRGVANQAKMRFPRLAKILGSHLKMHGNCLLHIPYLRLITFPVKHNWWEQADLDLIELSAKRLDDMCNERNYDLQPVYLPRPGCGNGGLTWEVVKPRIEFLGERFTIVNL